MHKLSVLTAALLAAVAMPAMAQISDEVVKIGILNDQSGVYADFGGLGSVEAAKMAVEEFGGKVLGPMVKRISPDAEAISVISMSRPRCRPACCW
mgnify:CR=1 FL=1